MPNGMASTIKAGHEASTIKGGLGNVNHSSVEAAVNGSTNINGEDGQQVN